MTAPTIANWLSGGSVVATLVIGGLTIRNARSTQKETLRQAREQTLMAREAARAAGDAETRATQPDFGLLVGWNDEFADVTIQVKRAVAPIKLKISVRGDAVYETGWIVGVDEIDYERSGPFVAGDTLYHRLDTDIYGEFDGESVGKLAGLRLRVEIKSTRVSREWYDDVPWEYHEAIQEGWHPEDDY